MWRRNSAWMSASTSWNSKPGDVRDVRLRALGGVGEDAVGVGVVGQVAVGDVELGADVGIEAVAVDHPVVGGSVVAVGDRRAVVVARIGLEELVVRGRRVLLEAVRPQQQLGRGVVVLVEDEVDHAPELLDRLGLGLGVRARPAIGLRQEVVAGALVVVAPVGGVVAVDVDAVDGLAAHAVGVVVVHVLAPQAVAGRERVLVAVRVVDADEPQLARVDELGGDRAVRRGLAVVAREVVQRALAGLARQPLARVLHRVVEHRRACVVGARLGARRDLERDDVAAHVGLAEDDLLDDAGAFEPVIELEVLLLVVARDAVVAAPDVERRVAADGDVGRL